MSKFTENRAKATSFTEVSETASTALQLRCQIIRQAFGLPVVNGDDACLHLVRYLREESTSSEQAMFVLYQLFLARFPSRTEINRFIRHFENDTPEQIRKHFIKNPEFQKGCQSHVAFRLVSSSTLVVDVTHTLTYP